jgi:hypothetical protein
VRPPTKSSQDFETFPDLYPLNEPIPKLEAAAQTAGEAEYINDIPERPGELHGAFVLTTQNSGTISNIDASNALSIPGVVAFFQATDIVGKNSFTPSSLGFVEDEEVISTRAKESKFLYIFADFLQWTCKVRRPNRRLGRCRESYGRLDGSVRCLCHLRQERRRHADSVCARSDEIHQRTHDNN